jgi:hypothetical protein
MRLTPGHGSAEGKRWQQELWYQEPINRAHLCIQAPMNMQPADSLKNNTRATSYLEPSSAEEAPTEATAAKAVIAYSDSP